MNTQSAAVLALLLGGCATGGSFDKVPGQDQATQIVWRDLYGMEDDPPPVEWIPGNGWGSAESAGGFTWAGWKVQVAKLDDGGTGSASISVTTFAHELMHYATYLRTGDVDACHWRGDWEMADGTARDALTDAGL